MALDLGDKRVLVVGAGGGIGGAAAKAFADAGAHVFAAGRPGAKLNAVAAEIGGESVALDILDNDAIEAFFATAEPFDHVVIAAAATKSGPVARLPLDDAKASMESKFWGSYQIARAAKVVDGARSPSFWDSSRIGRAAAQCCKALSMRLWRRSAGGWRSSARRSSSTPCHLG